MVKNEVIHRKLGEREARLTEHHKIITPESGVSAQLQAEWMIGLLQSVYSEHGIAKSPEKVVQSILQQDCRCWFVLENDRPVALTALVKQSDGSVELGRAVAISPGLGLGGIAMMRAGLEQVEQHPEPLVAEVRVADQFEGVPSGQATQHILLGLFGLKPHALAPMFSHGVPIRQEMFALATSQEKQSSQPLVLPEHARAQQHLQATRRLSQNLFDHAVEAQQSAPKSGGFELVQTAPFSILVPTQSGAKLERAEQAAHEANTFALLPIELTANNASIILQCLEQRWVACGVDRNLGVNGHPVLLLGKLKPGTLLAPTSLRTEDISPENLQALTAIKALFQERAV